MLTEGFFYKRGYALEIGVVVSSIDLHYPLVSNTIIKTRRFKVTGTDKKIVS